MEQGLLKMFLGPSKLITLGVAEAGGWLASGPSLLIRKMSFVPSTCGVQGFLHLAMLSSRTNKATSIHKYLMYFYCSQPSQEKQQAGGIKSFVPASSQPRLLPYDPIVVALHTLLQPLPQASCS